MGQSCNATTKSTTFKKVCDHALIIHAYLLSLEKIVHAVPYTLPYTNLLPFEKCMTWLEHCQVYFHILRFCFSFQTMASPSVPPSGTPRWTKAPLTHGGGGGGGKGSTFFATAFTIQNPSRSTPTAFFGGGHGKSFLFAGYFRSSANRGLYILCQSLHRQGFQI